MKMSITLEKPVCGICFKEYEEKANLLDTANHWYMVKVITTKTNIFGKRKKTQIELCDKCHTLITEIRFS